MTWVGPVSNSYEICLNDEKKSAEFALTLYVDKLVFDNMAALIDDGFALFYVT